MRTQNIATSGGVLTMTAYPGTVSDKPGIHYFSGTCYAKQQVNVSTSWPKWRVSGEFRGQVSAQRSRTRLTGILIQKHGYAREKCYYSEECYIVKVMIKCKLHYFKV